jgi:hypothetical protein
MKKKRLEIKSGIIAQVVRLRTTISSPVKGTYSQELMA